MTDLKWCETKTGKHWLKRDLGEGQTAKEWHDCESDKGKLTSIKESSKAIARCRDCKGVISKCNDWREEGEKQCVDCNAIASFCKQCMKHPQIMDVSR